MGPKLDPRDSASAFNSSQMSFTPDEWFLLVPLPPQGNVFTSGSPDDGAAEARAARPLTRAELLRWTRGSGLLHALLRAQLELGPWTGRVLLRMLLVIAVSMVLLVPLWTLNAGRFGFRQLVAGTVAAALFNALTLATWAIAATFRGSYLQWKQAPAGPATRDPAAADACAHPFAPLALWARLASSESAPSDLLKAPDRDPTRTAALLEHRDDDPLCPCPNPACSGTALARAAAVRLLEMLARIAVSAAFTVCVAWTPMVTFAADFWTSGWAAAGALLVVSFVNAVVVSSIGRFGTNVAVLRLALRVQAPRRHLRPAPAARPASGRCAASPRGGGTLRPAPRRAADHLGEAVHRRADDLGRLPRRRRLFVLPRHRHQPDRRLLRPRLHPLPPPRHPPHPPHRPGQHRRLHRPAGAGGRAVRPRAAGTPVHRGDRALGIMRGSGIFVTPDVACPFY